MTLSIFLYIFWIFLGIFFIFNLFLIRHVYKLRYLGKIVKYSALIYLAVLLATIIISHFYILRLDWDVSLF